MYALKVIFSVIVVGLLCGGSASFWPFHNDASGQDSHNVKQVAIIGAGAAGASTAYYLNQLAKSAGLAVNITVFEKSTYIGGRSTTVNAYNDSSEPVELGASIFVEGNKILKNATEKFGLQTQSPSSTDDETKILGIWNGEKFVYTQREGGWAWWDATKLIWKYGLAPIRTQRLMRSTVAKFVKLYDPPFFPFRSLSSRVHDLDLVSVTAVTGEQFLTANNIGRPFSNDIIQASTRVNYGQNLGIIHGLETMVCMAIEGAMQVKGGNFQIFSHMLKSIGANIKLNTTVTGIKGENGKYHIEASSSHGLDETLTNTSGYFDTVVLASPMQFSNIAIEDGILKHVPDKIPYVQLHVTLFTTPLKFHHAHFNLNDDDEVPNTVLTTLSPDEDPSNRKNIVGKPGFFSISTLRAITNPKTKTGEYLYKIFSPEKVTQDFLSSIFGIQDSLASNLTISDALNQAITWYYPYVWHSYPYEYPRVTFEELELARGFYYTAGIESFISTMETSALMGKNVAQLVVDDYLEVQGKMSIQDSAAQDVEKYGSKGSLQKGIVFICRVIGGCRTPVDHITSID